ncbi:MAG: hypothetical protein HY541_08515 [Deltaproteobacteria bacterium]|nr:hypothetical protein [Deltaproteobacteria bacterium]
MFLSIIPLLGCFTSETGEEFEEFKDGAQVIYRDDSNFTHEGTVATGFFCSSEDVFVDFSFQKSNFPISNRCVPKSHLYKVTPEPDYKD